MAKGTGQRSEKRSRTGSAAEGREQQSGVKKPVGKALAKRAPAAKRVLAKEVSGRRKTRRAPGLLAVEIAPATRGLQRQKVPPKSRAAQTVLKASNDPLRQAFLERAFQVVERMAQAAPEDVLVTALGKLTAMDTLATAMTALVAKDRRLDERDRTLAAARARGVLHMQNMLDRAGGAYSADQLAQILGKAGGRQTISAGRDSNLYFGLPTTNGYAYPKLQLTDDGEILPGLRAFLDAFTLPDPWMKLVVLLEPTPRLGGRTPLEALRAGDVRSAAAVAAAYGSHGA